MKTLCKLIPVLAAGAMLAHAQGPERSFEAAITGRGGDGKCTIEVNVDDGAIVEISGSHGRLITTAGRPAEWRRFVCNQPLPSYPADFRFRGIDGRGSQTLLRDPMTNRGVAVIRIDDPRPGREGYTFDLEWRAAGYNPPPPPPTYGERGGYRDPNVLVMSCFSDTGRRTVCGANTRGGVRIVRQLSQVPCDYGYTWGYDRRGIWVDRGCRAEFEVRR